MKKMVLGLTLLSCLNAFAGFETYECLSMSIRDNTNTEVEIEVDTEDKIGIVTIAGSVDEGNAQSDSRGHMITLGRGADTVLFSIVKDESINVVDEYLKAMTNEYDLTSAQVEQARAGIHNRVGDRKVNGTIIVFGQVASLLSCI